MELVARQRRAQSSRHEGVNLARPGVPLERCLREQQFAIERHLEPSAATRQECGPGDLWGPAVEELSRQTGGSIGVVSDDAVLDLELVRSVGRLGGHA